MPRNANGKRRVPPVDLEAQLAVVTERLQRVKDVAVGLGESRGIWTASAAEVLAAYIQEQADAALEVLAQLRSYPANADLGDH
jgi:hypothetical protein